VREKTKGQKTRCALVIYTLGMYIDIKRECICDYTGRARKSENKRNGRFRSTGTLLLLLLLSLPSRFLFGLLIFTRLSVSWLRARLILFLLFLNTSCCRATDEVNWEFRIIQLQIWFKTCNTWIQNKKLISHIYNVYVYCMSVHNICFF